MRQVRDYPFMGLSEIGNCHCQFPTMRGLLDCWDDDDGVHLTHAQAYTPLIKPFGNYRPFQLHPFLLTSYLLGRDYVSTRPALKRVEDGTAREYDYCALREAITLQMSLNRARFEVAATSRRLDSLMKVDLSRYARRVRNASLMVEVKLAYLVA